MAHFCVIALGGLDIATGRSIVATVEDVKISPVTNRMQTGKPPDSLVIWALLIKATAGERKADS